MEPNLDEQTFFDALEAGECDVIDSILQTGYIPAPKCIKIPCMTGDVNVLTRLLKYPMKVHQGLVIAVENMNTHLLDHLYAFGADLNYVDRYGYTALHKIEDLETCKWLIDMKAVQKCNDKGETPVYMVCTYADEDEAVEIASLLLDNGGKDILNLGDNPLILACQEGNFQLAKLLLEHGANHRSDQFGMTPLWYAVYHDNVEITKLLLNHGASQDIDKHGETVMHQVNTPEIAKLLLEYGGIQISNNDGNTPLHKVCEKGCYKTAKYLLKNGAILSYNNDGDSPLHLAASSGGYDIVNLLVKHNSKITKNNDGDTPLHLACCARSLEAAEYLIWCGHPQLANYKGETPLFKSIRSNNTELLRYLLDRGATHAADNNGVTPLHEACLACSNDSYIDIKLLLSMGAQQLPDNNGRTPLSIAQERGFDTLVELLKSYQE